jgi:hypothetical protein
MYFPGFSARPSTLDRTSRRRWMTKTKLNDLSNLLYRYVVLHECDMLCIVVVRYRYILASNVKLATMVRSH